MPRFVILTHDHPFPHWDFMLEAGEVLRTWRMLQSPDLPGSVDAEPIGDHRLHYLDYEGPVSDGRGTVKRWDGGKYTLLAEAPRHIEMALAGTRLCGRFVLDAKGGGNGWQFQLVAD